MTKKESRKFCSIRNQNGFKLENKNEYHTDESSSNKLDHQTIIWNVKMLEKKTSGGAVNEWAMDMFDFIGINHILGLVVE